MAGCELAKVVVFHLEQSILLLDEDQIKSLEAESVVNMWAEGGFKKQYLRWSQAEECLKILLSCGVSVVIASRLSSSLATAICSALDLSFDLIVTPDSNPWNHSSGADEDYFSKVMGWIDVEGKKLLSNPWNHSSGKEGKFDKSIFISDAEWVSSQHESFALHHTSRLSKHGHSPDFEIFLEHCTTVRDFYFDQWHLISDACPHADALASVDQSISCYLNQEEEEETTSNKLALFASEEEKEACRWWPNFEVHINPFRLSHFIVKDLLPQKINLEKVVFLKVLENQSVFADPEQKTLICSRTSPNRRSDSESITASILGDRYSQRTILDLERIAFQMAVSIAQNERIPFRVQPYRTQELTLLEYNLNRLLAQKVARFLHSRYIELAIPFEKANQDFTYVGPVVGASSIISIYCGPGWLASRIIDSDDYIYIWEV